MHFTSKMAEVDDDSEDLQQVTGSPCDEIDPAELFEKQGSIEVERIREDDRGSGSEFDSERDEHVDLSSENDLSDGFPYGVTPPRNVRRQKEKSKRDKEKVQEVLKSTWTREYGSNPSERAEQDRRKKRGSTQLTNERAFQRKLKRSSVDVGFVGTDGAAHPPDTSKSLEIPSIKIESTSRFMSLECVSEDSTDSNVCRFSGTVRTKSISIKRTITRSHRKATRSESDPRSSSSRNYLNPFCPEARMEFYRTFSLLIKLGSLAHKQQEKQYGVSPGSVVESQNSEESKKYQVELSQALWLELQAWHASKTMEEQDLYLIQARANVQEVLDEVINFKVKKQVDAKAQKPDQNSHDGNGNHILSDLNSSSDDKKVHCTGNEDSGTLAKLSCPNNSSMHNSCESNQIDHCLHSQETGDSTAETNEHISSESDSFVNSPSTNIPVYQALKRRLSLDLRNRNHRLHSDEADLDQAKETLPESTCCLLKAAIEQVTDLFDKVEMVENLYPTRHSLGQQHPKYTSKEFTRNFETMCLWLNVTRELNHKLHLIAKFVGVNVAETGIWQDWLDVGLGRLGTCVQY